MHYDVVGKPWFGGFTIDKEVEDGGQIGFADPIKGPQLVYRELAKAIIYQTKGRYGKNISELERFLGRHKYVIPDMRFPRGDPATPFRYASYIPSIVIPSEPEPLDLAKAVVFSHDLSMRWADMIWGFHTGSSYNSGVIATHHGQLFMINNATYGYSWMESEELNFRLEAIAQVYLAYSLPRNYATKPGSKEPRGLFAYIARAMNYHQSAKLVLDQNVFTKGWNQKSFSYRYSLFIPFKPSAG